MVAPYRPKPVDTAHVVVPNEVDALIERLAENSHDLWALARQAEGWTWGPSRDDIRKQHPDLVPYDELAESEKAYDRRVVVGTIKTLLALGYRIEPPQDAPR